MIENETAALAMFITALVLALIAAVIYYTGRAEHRKSQAQRHGKLLHFINSIRAEGKEIHEIHLTKATAFGFGVRDGEVIDGVKIVIEKLPDVETLLKQAQERKRCKCGHYIAEHEQNDPGRCLECNCFGFEPE